MKSGARLGESNMALEYWKHEDFPQKVKVVLLGLIEEIWSTSQTRRGKAPIYPFLLVFWRTGRLITGYYRREHISIILCVKRIKQKVFVCLILLLNLQHFHSGKCANTCSRSIHCWTLNFIIFQCSSITEFAYLTELYYPHLSHRS